MLAPLARSCDYEMLLDIKYVRAPAPAPSSHH
jgi:hypothetical protein